MPEQIIWHKSSYSATSGECVEVARTSSEVRVRDTKDRAGGSLSFGPRQWRALLVQAAAGS